MRSTKLNMIPFLIIAATECHPFFTLLVIQCERGFCLQGSEAYLFGWEIPKFSSHILLFTSQINI